MNVPNALSIFRIVLIPVFCIVYFWQNPYAPFWAGLVLLLSFCTDILDGYIARKFNQITDLGKILDPVADKLTQVAVVLCLYFAKVVPLFVPIFFAAKELIIMIGGALLMKDKSIVVSASWFGKVGTGLFYIIMMSLIAFPRYFEIHNVLKSWLIIVVILWAVVAGIMYTAKYFKIKKEGVE